MKIGGGFSLEELRKRQLDVIQERIVSYREEEDDNQDEAAPKEPESPLKECYRDLKTG